MLNFSPLIFFCLLLTGNSDNEAYQKAMTLAQKTLSEKHTSVDSMLACNGKIKLFILRDSVINKPGTVGTEYNYPIYGNETEITFYNGQTLACLEKRTIHLTSYQFDGVTTGIRKTAVIDPLNTFYFDASQNEISYADYLKIRQKICQEN